MVLSLKHHDLPFVLPSLHYGNSGPSCQQVCFVSEQDGQTVCTGVSFISLFSKHLASLIRDCQYFDEIITIIIPEPVDIIKKLLAFLSAGTVACDAIEDVLAVGKAADILGVNSEDWKIDTNVESKVKIEEDINSNISRNQGSQLTEEIRNYDKPTFRCEGYEVIFKSERCLSTHKGKHVSSSSAIKPDVVNSLAQVIRGKKRSCNLCSYTSRDNYNMRMHQERKHGLGPGYKCKFCDKTFKTNQDLSKHKPFCDPSSSTPKPPKMGKKVFFCDICGLSFKSLLCFNDHYKYKHTFSPQESLEPQAVDAFAKKVEGRMYECNLCIYTSRYKYNMRLHLERKHGLTPGYKCSVCNRIVKTKQDLSQHQLRKEC